MLVQKVVKTLPLIATLSFVPLAASAQNNKLVTEQNTVANTISIDQSAKSFENQKDTLVLNELSNTEQFIEKSKEKAKEKAKGWLSSPDTKTTAGINFVRGSNIPNTAIGVNVNLFSDKAAAGIDFLCARDTSMNMFCYDVHGKYNFDMGSGFAVYPKLAIGKGSRRYKGETQSSQMILPKVGVGVQYSKDFCNGIQLKPSFDVSGAALMTQMTNNADASSAYYCKSLEVDFLARLAASYKKLLLYIEVGKDITKGDYFGTGVNFMF